MWNFKRNRKQVPKYLKQNKIPSGMADLTEKTPVPGKTPIPGKQAASGRSSAEELAKAQKNITRQAMLAGLTVVLTIVILFAMTSAWYTNIVQTSGLVFEAESWGFDGKITVNENSIVAAPGDEGLVHLEVENTSSNISAISVNVNKLAMDREMQKRLFFYVDTHMNRDGETMERVYLNNREGYTYTVFSNGTLTLTEKTSNAPQLKWQWVYDVLGYYVVAKCEKFTPEDGPTVERTTVEEYLRPIEYDYDEATIVMEEDKDGNVNMRIATVDGTYSPDEFMEIISQYDGYEGQVSRLDKTDDGFYPVDVDEETGYGVYAYLCNYAEIELATDYDTELGELAYRKNVKKEELTEAELQRLYHKATLSISAQKNESTAINVTTLAALQGAITTNKADVIQLSDNITIPAGQSLTIPKDTRVMLDLNQNTINCQSDKAIDALAGSSLTVLNGNITGPGYENNKSYGVYTTGAEVVMSSVQMSNFRYGVYMGDNVVNNPLDSRVHMVNCTVDAGWYAVFINGNGTQSDQKTQVIIENSTLTSDGIVLTGSGNADRAGTDIQILNSTITAYPADENGVRGAGIYHPQKNSTMTIVDSTVSGYNGIAIKGGSVSVTDSVIEGTGAFTEPKENPSGFTDTGDAIYIDAGYGNDIQLEIDSSVDDNGKLKTQLKKVAEESRSLRVFPEDAINVFIKIYGGQFAEKQPEEYVDENSVINGPAVEKK